MLLTDLALVFLVCVIMVLFGILANGLSEDRIPFIVGWITGATTMWILASILTGG